MQNDNKKEAEQVCKNNKMIIGEKALCITKTERWRHMLGRENCFALNGHIFDVVAFLKHSIIK